ncbi:MAG: glycosyltransferase family 39 protein [Chloroflexi bacterium]|nr:glycosyltransferase family 39 protein [Chloroflexota bacterium]
MHSAIEPTPEHGGLPDDARADGRAPADEPRRRISTGLIWSDRLAPLLIVAIALPMRLANIGSYSGKADEGTRAEQLLLVAAGFRPVKDVFASQGPLSLDLFYPFFVMLGQTLAGARLAVVVYSVLAILAVYWVARGIGGRVGGWAAAALLIASPTFLKNSRLALVEIPATLPAILALGAALAYQRTGSRRWLVGSAAALAVALAIKPMVVAVVPAIGLVLLLRPVRRSSIGESSMSAADAASMPAQAASAQTSHFVGSGDAAALSSQRAGSRAAGVVRAIVRDLALYAAVCGVILAAIALYAGPAELYDQLIRYRVGSRAAEGWSLAENWSMLWGELQWDQPAFFVLATLAGLVLVVVRPRVGVPLASWAALSFVLLLLYSPLGTKHAALQMPPTALLAGAGVGVLWWQVARGEWRAGSRRRRTVVWAGVVGCGLALLAYAAAVPTVVARDRQALSEGDLGADPPYQQESALIQALTGPADFILVDDAYLAFLNGRMMPPGLVDTSIFLIRSGALSGAEVVAQAERYDVRLMLLVSDNLRQIKKFRDWADDEFVVVKVDERSNRKDRALYLRRDADLDAARTAVQGAIEGMTPVEGVLAEQLRVRGYALDQESVRAGGSVNLTVEWASAAPMGIDWRMVTFLRDRRGQVVEQTERSLGGGSGGTSTWEPGRWVFRTSVLTIPPKLPPGEYNVGVGIYDSKARRMGAVTSGDGVGGEEVRLGTLQVR